MSHNKTHGCKETIMLIGGGNFGGREHATTAAFLRSDNVAKVYVVPGNDALCHPEHTDPRIERIATKLDKKDARQTMRDLADRAKEVHALAFVGPENPLSQGIVDIFIERGIPIIGPTKEASRLEGSKAWAKDVMASLDIPIPRYAYFSDPDQAKEYIQSREYQVVVKASGLAEGRGSIVTGTVKEAIAAVHYLMEERDENNEMRFNGAGSTVVIEERLYGEEFSFFLITDGETILPLGWGRDYKPLRDYNKGPNTGGMGAYSPYGEHEKELTKLVIRRIAEPLIRGCRERYGIVYKGIMYIGGTFVRRNGVINPYVFEINVRMGDPEAQVIFPRLKSDLAYLSRAIVEGRLAEVGPLEWDPRYYLCVCLTSGRIWDEKRRRRLEGYPKGYKSGRPIYGLESLSPETLVFHNGTAWDEQRKCFISTGGRVLSIVGIGETLEEAREKTYQEVQKVTFEACHYRHDIGRKAIAF
jgi:phosphoribosylamine---glycine ligase